MVSRDGAKKAFAVCQLPATVYPAAMTTITKNCDDFLETEVDGEVVIVRLADGELYALSGTARAAWQAIDGATPRADIIARLHREYDAPADILEADLDVFLDDARQAGFLAMAGSAE